MLVIFPIKPGKGEANTASGNPRDDVVVDELVAVIVIHAGVLERDGLLGVVGRVVNVNVDVIANTDGVDPSGAHIDGGWE